MNGRRTSERKRQRTSRYLSPSVIDEDSSIDLQNATATSNVVDSLNSRNNLLQDNSTQSHAERQRHRRANMSREERENEAERQRNRQANMSQEESENEAERQRNWRTNMSQEQKQN